MIDLTSRMRGYALPLPAINGSYNQFVCRPSTRLLPGGRASSSLNFLSRKNSLFCYEHALFSADFARKAHGGMAVERDRSATTLLMDSGGFGFISGAIPIADIVDLRREALAAQEAMADAGVIVDVPTACIARGIVGASSFDHCLAWTQGSIDHAINYRKSGGPKLLNMIQGQTNREARQWYEEVNGAALEGYGFAGARRKDVGLIIELMARMAERGQIKLETWFHVFGTNHPGLAVLLTAVQRELRALFGETVRISFDSSTSFRFTQANGQVVKGLRCGRDEIRLDIYRVSKFADEVDPMLPWPFAGPLGEGATVGEFFPHGQKTHRELATDTVGLMALTHQSLWGELCAIIDANRLFDMEHREDWRFKDQRSFPYELHHAVEEVREIFRRMKDGDYKGATARARGAKNLAMFAGAGGRDEGDER